MISVEEALTRILSQTHVLPFQEAPLEDSLDCILARDVHALRTHPPVDQSAMDGYAVRVADVLHAHARLKVVGEAPAGGSYNHTLYAGEAVRIFTGGTLPDGADCIIIQENVTRDEGNIIDVREPGKVGAHIRKKGLDVFEGGCVLKAGQKLNARHIGLAATAGLASLPIIPNPRVALLFTGSELVEPGGVCGPNQIVNSNAPMLASLIRTHGGVPVSLGIVKDDAKALLEKAAGFANADICITVGGASVGDHDLVQPVLKNAGLDVDFWKIAMRPGKPLIFGHFNTRPFLGLPGNPVSALVCATLYLIPMLRKMRGEKVDDHSHRPARLGAALNSNASRQDYIRAALSRDPDGALIATPLSVQDSSMLSVLARADALIIRPPFAPKAEIGDVITILPF